MAFTRAKALALIERNIQKHGVHVYVVSGNTCPRFAYTIGLHPALGFELVMPGAIHYMKDEVSRVLNSLSTHLRDGGDVARPHIVDALGTFTLRTAHESWTRHLLLGAFDYHGTRAIPAIQVVPDDAHWTIDIPDMTIAWAPSTAPVWTYLDDRAWPYTIPHGSHAATDLSALRGARITEVARWEPDYWEMFASPDPDQRRDDMRVVSLTTLLGFDPTLRPIVDLAVGDALQRDPTHGDWRPWISAQNQE